jgi:hypothetical protein
MDAQEKVQKGYYINVRRDVIRPNTYVVSFAPKVIPKFHGWNNLPHHVPSPPSASVEIGGGEPKVRWNLQPSDLEAGLTYFEEEAVNRALKMHQNS